MWVGRTTFMAMLFYSDSGDWDPERESYVGILLKYFYGVLSSFYGARVHEKHVWYCPSYRTSHLLLFNVEA